MDQQSARKAVETVFRLERARLVAGLTKVTRDITLAEELAQDALVAALDRWPHDGIPGNPGAWLMMTAKRRAIDRLRQQAMQARKQEAVAHEIALHHGQAIEEIEAAMDDAIGDERLSLIFTACHPLLSLDARAALTLRLIGGLTTAQIARAFLAGEAAILQRITRAKKAIAEAGIAYEVPRGTALEGRLASVLEVIYLIYNEGYAASSGKAAIRQDLAQEAMRLGRILAALMPDAAEVHGLLALMELQASRFAARVDAEGRTVTLPDQDRSRWDRLLIARGLQGLARAGAITGADGFYTLQAAIAGCHARAARFEDTDWRQIAGLYDRLLAIAPSPVIALNRAIAHSMAFGPEAGLALLAELEGVPQLQGYGPLHAARADCLRRAGQLPQAALAYGQAASLSTNASEGDFLRQRAAQCRAG
ncbi:RNA polymerase sigma factor [Rhizobium halophytocola]|uniref:RNA polymerase sigma factor (Sigma-70 family) n=1 Tax=Rhizobium halophytocola TaxID=735519 RepID=A0ABS4DVQ9_9HYPH|nr:RNA polymerase sigma factor [Rhizobium halophytocola]MBP1849782.1 RNA polymerase sigma factor (sigma-70 family) [Rhizobium halophytocola]